MLRLRSVWRHSLPDQQAGERLPDFVIQAGSQRIVIYPYNHLTCAPGQKPRSIYYGQERETNTIRNHSRINAMYRISGMGSSWTL